MKYEFSFDNLIIRVMGFYVFVAESDEHYSLARIARSDLIRFPSLKATNKIVYVAVAHFQRADNLTQNT